MKIIRMIYIFLFTGSIIYLIDLLFDLFNNDDTQVNKQKSTLPTSSLNLELTAALAKKIDELNESLVDKELEIKQLNNNINLSEDIFDQ